MAELATTAGAPSPEAIDRDVRTLKEAVRVVLGGYGGAPSGDPKERLRATEWLHSFQRRDDAWNACVAVLGAPRGVANHQVGLNEQIFASQALLYKCRRRRVAITGEDVGCLLRLALGFTGQGLRAVLVQLCLGICACAVRHPGWVASKVVPDMVMFCQKASGDAGHGDPGPRVLVLELLTVLPDEATARAGISAPPEKRKEFLLALRTGGGVGRLALGVLSQLMEPGALPVEGAFGAILRCALAWMQLEAVERADMLASPVMALALEALESPEACDDACELLTASLEAFTEPGAAEEMLPRVLSRAQALAAPPSEDVCRCLAIVFAAAACAYLPGILRPELAGHWGSLLQIMVRMLEHPSLEIAGLALEFWGLLGELLAETSAGGRGPRSPPLEESVRHACRVSMLRARYPSVSDDGALEGMDGDAKDELEDFREQVQELMQTLMIPATPSEQEQKRSAGGTSGTRSQTRTGLAGPDRAGGSVGGNGGNSGSPASVGIGRGWEDAGVMVSGMPMSSGGGGGGAGLYAGLSSSQASSAAVVVTPDESRRSSSGVGIDADGGGMLGRRGLGEGRAGAWAEAARGEVEVMLSPVHAGLLEWLEGLAASSTREALERDHHRQQQQQQQQLQQWSHCGLSAASGSNNTNSGFDGINNSGGVPHAAIDQSGGRREGEPEGGGGGLPEGDWAGVEVVLCMLSATTKALNLRDCSPAAATGAAAATLGAGTSGDAAAAAAAAAAYRRHIAIIPADCSAGGAGISGRGTGATEALVQMLPALPLARRELQRSAAVLVGGLAAWLARRPRSLEPALQSVLRVLGLEEEAAGTGTAGQQGSMRDKGGDHVGVVALAKLVTAAGPSLAAVPNLPTHLLQRYQVLSEQLQRHRLLRPRPLATAGGAVAAAAQMLPSGRRAAADPADRDVGDGRASSVFPWNQNGGAGGLGGDPSLSLEQQRGGGSAEGVFGRDRGEAAPRPPPLHAGSLKLFLGCLCRMLGEAPMLPAGEARSGAVLDQQQQQQQQRSLGLASQSATGEVEEVLRALVEGELRCLRGVLDRRREQAVVAASRAEEDRAMADLAKDALSNLSLILGKTGPALDAPGLVAHCCGSVESSAAASGDGRSNGAGGGGGGVLVGMVEAFALGEEKILPHVCGLFEALVLSTSRRIRYFEGESPPRAGVNGNNSGSQYQRYNSSTIGGPHPVGAVGPDGAGRGGQLVEEGSGAATNTPAVAAAAAAGGLRISTVLGDALAEAFRRRPFYRFLEALRCITGELMTLRRSSATQELASAAAAAAVASPLLVPPTPDMAFRASEWVDQCLWAAAAEVAAGGANGIGIGLRSNNDINDVSAARVGGVGGGGAAGVGTAPELVEALFKLMGEWVKELPEPSLRWLQAWLSVAVSGLAVRHRGPARAVLGLIQACCSQRTPPQFSARFSEILRESALGVALTRGLLSGMCGAMPSWMLDDLVLTVRSLFDSVSPALASSWVDAVLRDPSFERYTVTSEHKVAFSRKLKEDFCNKDWRAFKAGLKAFCGGKKKGTGGTPPVHASATAAAAARLQAPVPPNPLLTPGQHYHHSLQQQQQQQQQFNGSSVALRGGGGPFGSSGGVVGAPGAVEGTGHHTALGSSQSVPRSVTM